MASVKAPELHKQEDAAGGEGPTVLLQSHTSLPQATMRRGTTHAPRRKSDSGHAYREGETTPWQRTDPSPETWTVHVKTTDSFLEHSWAHTAPAQWWQIPAYRAGHFRYKRRKDEFLGGSLHQTPPLAGPTLDPGQVISLSASPSPLVSSL